MLLSVCRAQGLKVGVLISNVCLQIGNRKGFRAAERINQREAEWDVWCSGARKASAGDAGRFIGQPGGDLRDEDVAINGFGQAVVQACCEATFPFARERVRG
ncbi:hypothetical protein Enr10x_15510 [Gimesia panareensis]|uniref:Uncharacterized protein n=1 Tax=Gimesia panareensis TaxID=2527978 RepID=A0A518A354_9PLAN|nr:hypothetical protein Enr10x_15510 [Gimesia panareensis]QDU49175.1 hypothetical protein Pan110_14940 [Gimesia panareensis]